MVDGVIRTATNCTRDTVGHAWVYCAAEPGVGVQHQWTVVVASQSSGPSVDTTSYRAPSLTGISGSGSSNANTDGGQLVFLNGLEFGPVSAFASVSNDALVSVVYGPVVRWVVDGCTVALQWACAVCSRQVP